ncbi:hypothetical protein TGRH88_034340 [Toxoplasma gondii]|uniref:Uncharacterized protein n=1 Tax=Toxoplasma gondii TaxID=5811 RepID=A0A7J6K6C1_TOXGO|nr:hypothetical protein TGRH88_034340 [Toxoplasma gondii]
MRDALRVDFKLQLVHKIAGADTRRTCTNGTPTPPCALGRHHQRHISGQRLWLCEKKHVFHKFSPNSSV